MKEDSAETEAKILAEIKQALGQPPHTITISNSIDIRSIGLFPSSSKSPTKQNDASFECTTSDETGSTDDYEHLPKVEDGNDSFMSSGSSPLQGSQIFYIDTVEEEEASIPRRANNLEVDDMRSRELMQIMERLYDNLRRSDDALSAERELRRSRERNLIKLAKELSWRKERMNKKDSQNKQVRWMWRQFSRCVSR